MTDKAMTPISNLKLPTKAKSVTISRHGEKHQEIRLYLQET